MGKGDDDLPDSGKVGLRCLPTLSAGGAVAHVTHSELTGQRANVGVGENAAHQAQVLADHDGSAIAHGDAGGFLAAVLQSAQAEIGETGDVAVGAQTPNTPHSSCG